MSEDTLPELPEKVQGWIGKTLEEDRSEYIQLGFTPPLKTKKKRRGLPAAKPQPPPLLTAQTLEIRERGDAIELSIQTGERVKVVADGKTVPVTMSGWSGANATAVQISYWEEDSLVLESTLDGGLHITQSYYLDGEGLLVQDIELSKNNGDQQVVKRRFRPQ